MNGHLRSDSATLGMQPDIFLSFHFRGSDNIHLLSCKLLKEKKKERSEGGRGKGGVRKRKEESYVKCLGYCGQPNKNY